MLNAKKNKVLPFSVLFVYVEVLWPSQHNGVMSSVISLPNHTFTGHTLSFKHLTSIVHILSPETVLLESVEESK